MNAQALRLAYVVPVHDEAQTLSQEVYRLSQHLAELPGHFEILLVENGSRDGSAQVAQQLVGTLHGVSIRAASLPQAGLGYAYHYGIVHAFAEQAVPAAGAWVLLTAGDLPFGFSDLAAFIALRERQPELKFAIGSKAHPDSVVNLGLRRRLMSRAYRSARYWALGMRAKDSQGTLFVRLDLARALAARTRARGFFFSTEFVYLAEQAGEDVIELPVQLRGEVRPSTVRVVRDSARMFGQLLRLRARRRAD